MTSRHTPALHSSHYPAEGEVIIVEDIDVEGDAGEDEECLEKGIDLALLPSALLSLYRQAAKRSIYLSFCIQDKKLAIKYF